MHLASPFSAILSAVIFNALIIVVLIPLALKGVKYRPLGAAVLLRRNLLIYGLGGILVPFVGIKLIDLVLVTRPHSGLSARPSPQSCSHARALAVASGHRAVRAPDGADRHRLSAGRHRHRAGAVSRARPQAA